MTSVQIHGNCILCAGAGYAFGTADDAGVVLLGESGSGKSDLALRLIAMGGRLVADDRCELFFDGVALRARSPRNIAGIIEIRGVGIVALPHAAEARVALVVRVGDAVERFPDHRTYEAPSLTLPNHLRPPQIAIDAFAASAPAKVLAAVAAFEKQLFREDIPP